MELHHPSSNQHLEIEILEKVITGLFEQNGTGQKNPHIRFFWTSDEVLTKYRFKRQTKNKKTKTQKNKRKNTKKTKTKPKNKKNKNTQKKFQLKKPSYPLFDQSHSARTTLYI